MSHLRSFLACVYCLSSILFISGCGEDEPSSPTTPTVTKGKITGTLVRKENNQPVNGAKVTLVPSGVSATTTNGYFAFSNVSPGTYAVIVDWGDRGNGGITGVKVIAGQTTPVTLNISTPVGTWTLSITFTTTRTLQLDYYDDLTYETTGSYHQIGTWRVRDGRITMTATSDNDTWSGDYDPFLMTGTVLSLGKTGTWSAIR